MSEERNKTDETNEIDDSNETKFFTPAGRDAFYVSDGGQFVKSRTAPAYLTVSNPSKKYTPDQVRVLLKNPYGNAKVLQDVSEYLYAISPAYQNLLYYNSTIMTFDYVLYPVSTTDNETTMKNRFLNSAKISKRPQVKTIYPTILHEVLKVGEAYVYELDDEQNTIYDFIPSSICQLAFIDDDNLWRYWVDLSRITNAELYELPSEISRAYSTWIEGGKKKTKTTRNIDGSRVSIPSNYYLVSKKGKCLFAHMKKEPHDYPFFASMFPDLIEHENNKEYFNEVIKENNIKIIHLEIPISKESGLPLMDKETIQAYHESAKNHLPNNVAPMTNPFKVEGIAVDKAQQSGINLVDHSSSVIQNDSGVSDAIFSASTTNGLKYSTQADASKIFPLRYYFENIMNYRIKDHKYKVTILPVHQNNQFEWHEIYSKDLLSGGSRFMWISTAGIEPYDYIMLIESEKLFDIDSLLIPKINASQISGDSENGRPETKEDDKADSTIEVDNRK